MKMKLGIFASGNGSNAVNISKHFASNDQISVAKIYCNNPAAGIITKAFTLDVALHLFTRKQLIDGSLLDQLRKDKIDIIILAGFLWLIPPSFVKAYPNRIINIHPALLPNYGGKGMYGMRVHEAVVKNKEVETGITIHLVDEKYDNGGHLFQAKVPLTPDDDAQVVAEKIHKLEQKHFPEVIENYLNSL